MEFIVSKFGGWANSTAERVKLAADLFEKNSARRIKVNSAIGKVEGLPKVTDLLVQGAEASLKEGKFPEEIFEKIKLNHYAVFEPLGIDRKEIDKILSILEGYIAKKDSLSSDNYRALIVGSGEELFSRLDAIYLKEIRGLNARYIDPREIGHYLSGHPLDGKIIPSSYNNLAKLRDYDCIVVYPGFFAVDEKGRPMIYSRGGTDKTAADISVAVKATSYENWKDVDGIYSADPRIVNNPKLMEEVTYKEIRELSYISFNVLHQEAMIPTMKANIPIVLKNLLKPDHSGTKIVNQREIKKEYPVVGIAHLENICFVNVEKTLMNEYIGFADELLDIFKEHKINIEQITTGIDSMCLVVQEKEFKDKSIHTGVAEAFRKEVNIEEFMEYVRNVLDVDSFQIRKNKALICIVGEGMRHTVGILSRVCGVLARNGINIEIIDQGPSERNIIVGIDCNSDKDNAKKAVNYIYQEFFK
ncbi:MAG TPA: aspartate kinase [Spirochaetota bacterium]|nr:aspartate kinase [Spirochaetota bacterium]HOL56547.1 aspartate kinase [Spirochaetota bacterium]HPP03990.1 aspartate kinase [Spirochaetota bacterium]